VRGGLKLNRTLVSFRHHLASLGGHQRKMFLAFRICARPISSKKERTFFFGVLPSKYSGRWRGFNADEVLQKLFSGGKDFAKLRLILF
jgi:hypothetical protein